MSLYKGKIQAQIPVDTDRMPREDEGRDCGDASIHQGKPRVASTPPEVREAWNRLVLTALQTPRFHTSNLNHETTTHFCCFSHSLCGTMLWQPQPINIPHLLFFQQIHSFPALPSFFMILSEFLLIWAYYPLSMLKMPIFYHGLFLYVTLHTQFLNNIKILWFKPSPIFISKPHISSKLEAQLTQHNEN